MQNKRESKRISSTLFAALFLTLLAATANAQSETAAKWRWLTGGQPAVQPDVPTTESLRVETGLGQTLAGQGGILDVLEQQKRALVGAWLLTDEAPGRPPLKALASFNGDGVFHAAEQGDVKLDPNGVIASVAFGSWAHNGGRQFALTFLQLGSSATGELIGTVKVKVSIALNDAGDQWSGPYRFTIFDPNGQALFSGNGTLQAQRIKVEP